jgi:hypothetical protein
MRSRFVLPIIISLAFYTCAGAQSPVKKRIKKGRRNKAEHQLILPKNTLQAEWEFGNEVINDSLATYVYPNLVLRYGISKLIELNLEINPITTVQKSSTGKRKISGIEPVMAGAAIAVMDETKCLPEIGLSLQVAPPFAATKNYAATHWAPLLQCTMQKNYKRYFSISGSGGLFYDGFTTKPNWLYSIAPAYNINKQFSISADMFGFAARRALPMNNIDLDLACQLNKRLHIGVTAGKGISSRAHKDYIGINGSFVLMQKNSKAENK